MNNITFSIVIPLYNKQTAISKTLQSVLSQTYANYEVIVVDDGSTDESVERVKNFNDPRLNLIQKENGGVCSARNKGIKEAKYEYIALLDGDDQWHEDYLAEQVRLIKDFPEAKMWGINFAEMNNGKLVRALPTGLPDGYRGYIENYFQMQNRVSDLFCSSSVIIDRTIFEQVGYFDERIKYAEDNDMWFRIIVKYPVAFYDRYMAFYRFDAENRASSKTISLKYFLPYYVDKYSDLRDYKVFYTWIHRWAANHIRKYYFEEIKEQRVDACEAVKKLDYSVIPVKYKYLYKMPYALACIFNQFDKWYHK